MRNVFLLQSHKNILDLLSQLLIINIKPNSFINQFVALINKNQVSCHVIPCVFTNLSFSSILSWEFPWFHIAIFITSHTVVSFLCYFKVMAAAVRLPAPGGHEDPLPPFPSLRLLGHRRHAEVLRPHRHRHLWHQHHWVSTFRQLYSRRSKNTNMVIFRINVVFLTLFWVDYVLSLAEPWVDHAVACQISLVPSWRATWGGSDTPSRAWSGTRMRSLSRESKLQVNVLQRHDGTVPKAVFYLQ